MNETIQIIGKRIRKYRNELHLSQEALAERAGLHFTYIGQIERGEKNITIGSLEKICRSLNISFEELFEGIGPSCKNSDTQQKIMDLINEQPASVQEIYLNVIRELSKI